MNLVYYQETIIEDRADFLDFHGPAFFMRKPTLLRNTRIFRYKIGEFNIAHEAIISIDNRINLGNDTLLRNPT